MFKRYAYSIKEVYAPHTLALVNYHSFIYVYINLAF